MNFVVSFGKKLIDIVHSYGKKAYVFYDDSWIGVEPYSKRFSYFIAFRYLFDTDKNLHSVSSFIWMLCKIFNDGCSSGPHKF